MRRAEAVAQRHEDLSAQLQRETERVAALEAEAAVCEALEHEIAVLRERLAGRDRPQEDVVKREIGEMLEQIADLQFHWTAGEHITLQRLLYGFPLRHINSLLDQARDRLRVEYPEFEQYRGYCRLLGWYRPVTEIPAKGKRLERMPPELAEILGRRYA